MCAHTQKKVGQYDLVNKYIWPNLLTFKNVKKNKLTLITKSHKSNQNMKIVHCLMAHNFYKTYYVCVHLQSSTSREQYKPGMQHPNQTDHYQSENDMVRSVKSYILMKIPSISHPVGNIFIDLVCFLIIFIELLYCLHKQMHCYKVPAVMISAQ